MKVNIFSACALMVCCTSAAHADTYRCTGEDGKVVYQQSPCAAGAQKVVNDSDAREKAKAATIKRKEDGELQNHAERLRACIDHKICAASDYILYLRGKSLTFVTEALGNPSSAQNFDGNQIQYFDVPTTDGSKRARLQISYQRGIVHDPHGKFPDFIGPVVRSVNVY